ncbi:DUF6792 domain-containing protein [Bacillus sp. FSL W7-1360]
MALPESFRNALVQKQYGDIDEKTIEKLLKEHNIKGVNPKDITVYTSGGKNIDGKIGDKSGFDGAAVHIYNKESGRNEVYYVARGTQLDSWHDITYDGLGVTAGEDDAQIEDALEFYEKVEAKIAAKVSSKDVDNIERYGDGHSLGGHVIVTLALLEKGFTDVRGLNAAPVHLKQLAKLDRGFGDHIVRVTGKKDIDSLSEQELTELAKSYYQKEISNIKHLRVKGEPLYAQTIPFTQYFGRITMLGDYGGVSEFPNLLETYATGKYGIDKYLYHQVLEAVFAWLERTGRNSSTDEIANAIENLTIFDLIGLGVSNMQYIPALALLLEDPHIKQTIREMYAYMDQMDLHDMKVVIAEFYVAEAISYMTPDRVGESFSFIESVMRTDRTGLFYSLLRGALSASGAGKRVLLAVDTLNGFQQYQFAAEDFLGLVQTDHGAEITVTKMNMTSQMLAIKEEFEDAVKMWMEKIIEEVEKQKKIIQEYWDQDEEMASSISAMG